MSEVHEVFAASADASRRRRRRLAERLAAVRRRRSRRSTLAGACAVLALAGVAPLAVGAAVEAGDPDAAPAPAAGSNAPAAGVLKIGSSGADVRSLQRKLRLRADGQFGPATRRAVMRFQRRNELKADGVVGRSTRSALGLPVAPAAPAGRSDGPVPTGARAATLAQIAECESGGDPKAVSASGTYRGKYQFDRPTWRSVGGSGDPAAAPEAEQDARAATLLERRGTAPWPVCGARA